MCVNDVFCGCFDTRAQPLQPPRRRRLRQAQRGRNLLGARASGCHLFNLFNGEEFLHGTHHYARKHLGFETHEAVAWSGVTSR